MHLVENILHFSRAERRMTRLGPEPVDLSQAVQAIVDDWLPLATAADVRVDTRFAPDVHAFADRGALRQMVLNLLDNAVKYGPPCADGHGRHERDAAVARACGWTTRAREFRRASASASSSRSIVWTAREFAVAGSGIGLYVVRELARLHGGDAWVEDAPGGGARVVIELSAADRAPGFTDEHATPSRARRPSARRSRGRDAHSHHRGQQEPRDRSPQQPGDRRLRGGGRGDGTSGLAQARSTSPDLIVLDLMLPGMDGYRVLANAARRGHRHAGAHSERARRGDRQGAGLSPRRGRLRREAVRLARAARAHRCAAPPRGDAVGRRPSSAGRSRSATCMSIRARTR